MADQASTNAAYIRAKVLGTPPSSSVNWPLTDSRRVRSVICGVVAKHTLMCTSARMPWMRCSMTVDAQSLRKLCGRKVCQKFEAATQSRPLMGASAVYREDLVNYTTWVFATEALS